MKVRQFAEFHLNFVLIEVAVMKRILIAVNVLHPCQHCRPGCGRLGYFIILGRVENRFANHSIRFHCDIFSAKN